MADAGATDAGVTDVGASGGGTVGGAASPRGATGDRRDRREPRDAGVRSRAAGDPGRTVVVAGGVGARVINGDFRRIEAARYPFAAPGGRRVRRRDVGPRAPPDGGGREAAAGAPGRPRGPVLEPRVAPVRPG